MKPVERIGSGIPPSRVSPVADRRRKPEPDQRQQREKNSPPEKSSDGHDHIIDELA